jgi:hypothetical protein
LPLRTKAQRHFAIKTVAEKNSVNAKKNEKMANGLEDCNL